MSAMNQNISLKQKQELALKPKMLQSLKMLALPILELESYIKQELESNPLLELRDEKDEEDLVDSQYEQAPPESNTPIEDVDSPDEVSETVAEARQLTDILDQWNEYHSSNDGYRGDGEVDQNSDAMIRYEGDAKESYLEQLYPLDLAENEIEFITDLVDSCDVYGFLPKGFSIAQSAARYRIPNRRAEELHQIVLHLQPKGISSRDISECLLAQLSEDQKENPIIYGLVTEHFENLIHRRFQKIASHYNVSEDTILLYRDQIAKLDPKPGLRILSSSAAYVYPDVTLKMIDGEYVVIINDHIPEYHHQPQIPQDDQSGIFRQRNHILCERAHQQREISDKIHPYADADSGTGIPVHYQASEGFLLQRERGDATPYLQRDCPGYREERIHDKPGGEA
jgi:RNA polymerase sigma-54 factor